ncbi:MAG: glycyl-radical enzyme activating protein [Clostridia bacterium]|nr:glycyl-radical enzyme activating protein [Clostridia bacterium]
MNYENITGRIFDIQRFSVHDGPGIRTIIFLKGCALRCKWCCNPESQSFEIETMKLDDGKEKLVGRDVTVREIIETVEKDMPYYRRSGGGLTLSGGESLLQPQFAEGILRACQERGINTAIETTSVVDYKVIEPLLPLIDTYMMDIKHINPEKHKAFTGKDNQRILENAIKIDRNANKMIVRVPVIPTFNDTEEEIREIATFVSKLEKTNEMHLLPYHKFGTDKYRWLGRDYTMPDVDTPTDEKMERLKKTAESLGITCRIGG